MAVNLLITMLLPKVMRLSVMVMPVGTISISIGGGGDYYKMLFSLLMILRLMKRVTIVSSKMRFSVYNLLWLSVI